jgi:hypothetical protein
LFTINDKNPLYLTYFKFLNIGLSFFYHAIKIFLYEWLLFLTIMSVKKAHPMDEGPFGEEAERMGEEAQAPSHWIGLRGSPFWRFPKAFPHGKNPSLDFCYYSDDVYLSLSPRAPTREAFTIFTFNYSNQCFSH